MEHKHDPFPQECASAKAVMEGREVIVGEKEKSAKAISAGKE